MKTILPVVASFAGASPCCDLYCSTMAFAQACATRKDPLTLTAKVRWRFLSEVVKEGFVGHNAGRVDVDINSAEVLDDLRDRIDNLVADSDVNVIVLDFDIVL